MKRKIPCKEFIKNYGKNIEAFQQSLHAELIENDINGLLKFMRYQGVEIYLENNEMYLYE